MPANSGNRLESFPPPNEILKPYSWSMGSCGPPKLGGWSGRRGAATERKQVPCAPECQAANAKLVCHLGKCCLPPWKHFWKGRCPFKDGFRRAWLVLPWIASHNFWLAIHDSTGGPCLRVQLKGKISSGEGTTPHCQSAVCHSGRCWWTSLESTVFRQAALGSTIEKESSLASLWMASLTWQQHLKRTFHFNHPFRWTGGSSSSSWYPQCNVIMLGVLYGGPAPSWKAPQRPVLVLHRSWILYDSIAKHTDTMMTVILMCSQG